MAIPDPATTDWVPVWNPQSAGPQGPQGPAGPTGPQGIAGNAVPHHLTHERGGIDEVLFPTGIVEHGRSVPMGEWIQVPFNAANFSGDSGMTWAVSSSQILSNAYTIIGKTVVWTFLVASSTLGGTASTAAIITLPGGFTSGISRCDSTTYLINNGVPEVSRILVPASATFILILKLNTALNLALGDFAIGFTITFPIT